MNETEKPFACSEKGCEMTFTNEDHLNWHQKKHDMILNLGLAKNDVADQTPTPTRFIRNCEEVGLFQDLQNENPFDEHFKRAIELTKNGRSLDVPETNSDDTLHTPHILPHVEENRKKPVSNSQDDNNSRSNEFSLNGVIQIENMCTSEVNVKEPRSTSIIVIDDDSNSDKDIKKRIKNALQSKEKQRLDKENHGSVGSGSNTISVVPFKNLTDEKEKSQNIDKNQDKIVDESREKIREMNRAAQIRCRKRKQMKWKEMEEELIILKNENKKLKVENYKLQYQLRQMKKSLESEETPKTTANVPALLPQIIPDLNGTSTNPIVIQIIPSTSNSTLSATESTMSDLKIENVYSLSKTGSSSRSSESGQQKVKKGLRKIIPKIIIEN